MGDDRSRFECPPQDRVAAYVQGGLGQADTVKFEAHMGTCAPCGRRLAMTRTLGRRTGQRSFQRWVGIFSFT